MTEVTHCSMTPLLSDEKTNNRISSYNNKSPSENTELFLIRQAASKLNLLQTKRIQDNRYRA